MTPALRSRAAFGAENAGTVAHCDGKHCNITGISGEIEKTAWHFQQPARGCYALLIRCAACLSMYPTNAIMWKPASVAAYRS